MAKPRKRSSVTVTLFPFLSVLAAVIGTLALVITGTLISSIQGGRVGGVYILPGGEERFPIVVQCSKGGLLVPDEETRIPDEEIEKENGRWAKRVKEMAAHRDTEYVLFLVQPDGVSVFRKACWMAEDQDIEIGCDAVYGDVEVVQESERNKS